VMTMPSSLLALAVLIDETRLFSSPPLLLLRHHRGWLAVLVLLG
jgi:hypothetical protein